MMPAIAALGARTVIYVSCDPMTFCRDASELAALGYRHAGSVVFDMFPQSYHMETLNVFRRKEDI
jgi:23S rRNA (uracil1939-C5)-methyltransferase